MFTVFQHIYRYKFLLSHLISSILLTPCTPMARYVHCYLELWSKVKGSWIFCQTQARMPGSQPRLGLTEDSRTTDSGCNFAWSGQGYWFTNNSLYFPLLTMHSMGMLLVHKIWHASCKIVNFPWAGWNVPDFSHNFNFPWPILKFPDFSLTLNFPDFSLISGKPE